MTWPEGWGIESGDPSVGIFGDFIWHDDCPDGPGDDPAEAVAVTDGHRFVGEGANRSIIYDCHLECPSCGASSPPYEEADWTPEFDEEAAE